ncbi:MAG: hypothetical protein ACRDDZ_05080 [Marinifilaceae bacterium]
MKNCVIIKHLLYMLLCVFCLSGCVDKTLSFEDGDNFAQVNININISGNQTVSRTSQQEDITDLNILAFNAQGELMPQSNYVDTYTNGNLTLTVKSSTKRIAFIANAGRSLLNNISTYNDLMAYSFPAVNGSPYSILLGNATKNGSDNLDITNNDQLSVSLIRLFAKVSVYIDIKELNAGINIQPYKAILRNVPASCHLGPNNKITQSAQSIAEGDYWSSMPIDLSRDYANPIAQLLQYENRQENGYFDTHNGLKVPNGYTVNNMAENKTCSYLEIYAKYNGKDIIYRYYIGKDINNVNNSFDIERNYDYRTTLTLKGDASTPSWKTEPQWEDELDINIYNSWVSYEKNEQANIALCLGDGNMVTTEPIYWHFQSGNSGEYIELLKHNITTDSPNVNIPVRTLSRNGDVTKGRNFTIKVTATYQGVNYSKDIPIYQERRICYPIGIMWSNNTTKTQTVDLKYFDKGNTINTLTDMKWKGNWEATITEGDNWLVFSNNKTTTSGISSGTQGITFDIRPTTTGPQMENRFGEITISYMDGNCTHKIYVQQGNADQRIDHSSAIWTQKYAVGLNQYNNILTTKNALETGWQFKYASNIGVHPSNPGFNLYPSGNHKLSTSHGDTHPHWDKITYEGNNWYESGIMPYGYFLPDNTAWNNLKYLPRISTISGFVLHDNTSSDGYDDILNAGQAVMGTMFYRWDQWDTYYNGTFLFFTYGQGGHGIRIANENGTLGYNGTNGYGAAYWNNSGKSYVLLDFYNESIDIMYNDNNSFQSMQNGHFIRYVR